MSDNEIEDDKDTFADLDEKLQQKVTRRLSVTERNTLGKALDEVKKVSASYTDRGLSPWTFFIGQINIAITWYILGHNPESYWIFMVLKCYFYLGASWKIKIETKTDILYMLEFCWVAAHIYMTVLSFALLQVFGVESEWLRACTATKTGFMIFYGLANGPFAVAVIIFKNALVLHDIPNLASAFIHLTPSSLSWVLRWWAPKVMQTYPGIFDLPDPSKPFAESFWDLFLPTIGFYYCWFFFYVLYMYFVGRHHGSPWSKFDTLYFWTMKNDKSQAKFCGYDESTPEKRKRMGPIMKYMFIHNMLFGISPAIAYLCYMNFWVHTAWCCLLFVSCTYYGALRYYNMMTRYYIGKLEKMIKRDFGLTKLDESRSAKVEEKN